MPSSLVFRADQLLSKNIHHVLERNTIAKRSLNLVAFSQLWYVYFDAQKAALPSNHKADTSPQLFFPIGLICLM